MADFGSKMPGGMSQMQNQMDPESQKKIEQQQEEQVQMKHMMLASLLDQQARARLNNLKLSKPEKAETVENIIIQMAQRGQIGGKLDDKSFTQLLESLNQQMTRSTSGIKVKYDRRRNNLDSDDDEEDY